MKKFIALFLCVLLAMSLVACDGNEEPTTLTEESTTEEAESTTEDVATTEENAQTTLQLVTVPGSDIPTVVTSEWNTTLPPTTATTAPVTETTTNLTAPDVNITKPVVNTTVVPTTVPTTLPTTQSTQPSQTTPGTDNTTQGSEDASSTTETTQKPSTTSSNPQPVELVYEIHGIDGDGNLVVEFNPSGWSSTIKSGTQDVEVRLNGEKISSKIKLKVSSGYNIDGNIEVTLSIGSQKPVSGDVIEFTIPENVIRTTDNACYNSAYYFSDIYQ